MPTVPVKMFPGLSSVTLSGVKMLVSPPTFSAPFCVMRPLPSRIPALISKLPRMALVLNAIPFLSVRETLLASVISTVPKSLVEVLATTSPEPLALNVTVFPDVLTEPLNVIVPLLVVVNCVAAPRATLSLNVWLPVVVMAPPLILVVPLAFVESDANAWPPPPTAPSNVVEPTELADSAKPPPMVPPKVMSAPPALTTVSAIRFTPVPMSPNIMGVLEVPIVPASFTLLGAVAVRPEK